MFPHFGQKMSFERLWGLSVLYPQAWHLSPNFFASLISMPSLGPATCSPIWSSTFCIAKSPVRLTTGLFTSEAPSTSPPSSVSIAVAVVAATEIFAAASCAGATVVVATSIRSSSCILCFLKNFLFCFLCAFLLFLAVSQPPPSSSSGPSLVVTPSRAPAGMASSSLFSLPLGEGPSAALALLWEPTWPASRTWSGACAADT
mmetsp:Transcript_6797/g.19878  ORF Transcript_6797/g.19878 Transcript_6797/m.19878 type:complete len:202 (-) Transcript_6797:658-1263(-)